MEDLVYSLLSVILNLIIYHLLVCRIYKVVINHLYRGFSLEEIEESCWHKNLMVLIKVIQFFIVVGALATSYKVYLLFKG